MIYIRDDFPKNTRSVRQWAQANFIKKDTCERLGLMVRATKHTISCLNVTETKMVEMIKTVITLTTTSHETNVNLLVVNQITQSIPFKLINTKLTSEHWIGGSFHQPQDIELLLLGRSRNRLNSIGIQATYPPINEIGLADMRTSWIVCRITIMQLSFCMQIRNEEL